MQHGEPDDFAQAIRTVEAMAGALDKARNGLAWYRAEFPEADSEADNEAMAEIDAALDAYFGSAAPAGGGDRNQCSMGVGCDEAGVCYAAAHDQPDRCPKQPATPAGEPHCTGHERFDYDCIDCSDALERQRKAAALGALSRLRGSIKDYEAAMSAAPAQERTQ